jgi:outer membrane protein assembly factor BamB
LSRGHFEQALALYDRAERTADATLMAELAPRKRLAGAMLGRDLGAAATSNVQLGDVQIAAAEFEAMVAQMRQRAAAAPETVVQGAVSAPLIQEAPSPAGYTAAPRARLDGPAGERPNELPRHVREGNVDWAARQMAWAIEGDTLYASNRFHVAAYDLTNGQRRWQSPGPPGKAARAHDWTLVPMRPLVTEKHVLTRLLTGDGPVLACLDKQNGQIVWTSQPPPGEWLASDPLVVQGRLLLLRVRQDGAREASLVLCDYDAATGEPRDQQELLRLREPSWTARHVCQAAVVDDAIVAVLGGCVVCADLAGGVRWVRRQLYLPPDEDPTWGGQHQQPPLWRQGRLYLAQPGVRSLECVDPDTGRSHWTRTLPEVQRILGIVEQQLIVETEGGFVSLDPDDGSPRWRRETPSRLEGRLGGGAGGLLYVRQISGERDDTAPRPELVWLDPQTGHERASFALHDLKRPELRFGPLIAHKGRLWAFAGAGPQDPHRDLIELAPQGDAVPALPPLRDVWLRHFGEPIQWAAARVLSDWRPFRGIAEKHNGYYAEMHGERGVMSLDGTRSQPVVFARQITIPASGRAKLRLRLAMEQLRPSNLQVEFRGERVWEQKLDDQSLGSKQWRDFEADLSTRAGQTGWVMVRLAGDNDDRFTSYWKRLEIAF